MGHGYKEYEVIYNIIGEKHIILKKIEHSEYGTPMNVMI